MNGTNQQTATDWPRKIYAIDLDALRILADAVCELDALKGYLISTERPRIAKLIEDSLDLIEAAAGPDVGMIFDMSGDAFVSSTPSALKPALRELISKLAAARCEAGWTNDSESAGDFATAAETRPGWSVAWVTDLFTDISHTTRCKWVGDRPMPPNV